MRSWIKTFCTLALSLFIICGIFAVIRYFTAPRAQMAPEQQESPTVQEAVKPLNILVLGVDEEQTRTDTILAISYQPDKNAAHILSVPRDTRVYFGGDYHKINAAYGRGGAEQSQSVVTALTGLPFDRYMVFTTSSFRDIIDALGGVYFDVPRDMYYRDPVQGLTINLKKGRQLLNGEQSEQLVRYRRYPEGDIARVHMQQQFFHALAEQKLNASIIKSLPRLYSVWSNNIKTNITAADITAYLSKLSELSAENVSMHDLPGAYNDTDYGTSYWICNKTKTAELIRSQFGYENGNYKSSTAGSDAAAENKSEAIK